VSLNPHFVDFRSDFVVSFSDFAGFS